MAPGDACGNIVHSDRGSQYCSAEYQRLPKDSQLVCSMSKQGDCYDNAAMESWNHSFKVEAIHGERFKTRDSAKTQVFDYIEVFTIDIVCTHDSNTFRPRRSKHDKPLIECPEFRGKINIHRFFGGSMNSDR